MGAVVHEPEQGEHPRPCRVLPLETIASARRGSLKLREQAGQPIRTVVQRVISREEFARLREQHHDHPHYDAYGCAVDVGGINVGAPLLQCFAMRLDQQLDGCANALA